MPNIKFISIILMITSLVIGSVANSQILKVGDNAPDFTAVTDEGSPIKLSDFAGKNVVLYFYPQDLSKGCTIEAARFNENLKQFTDLNTVILGVSTNDISSHKEFKDKESLKFSLIADPDKNITKQYGALNEDKGNANRITYVINSNGQIVKIYPQVDVNTNYKEVLEYLAALQSDNRSDPTIDKNKIAPNKKEH